VFILTDENSYSRYDECEIAGIFSKLDYKVNFMGSIRVSEDENKYAACFFSNIKNKKGVDNEFVPRLMFRKYMFNEIVRDYCINNNINRDVVMVCRLFDTLFKSMVKFDLECGYVYGSPDIVFFGNATDMDYILNVKLYHDIWSDEFIKFMTSIDLCLCECRATYSPEIQYMYHIFVNKSIKYKNIRVDYNNTKAPPNYFDIRLDPDRFRTSYNIVPQYIEYVAQKIDNVFLSYFSDQGLMDFNKGIGIEHYKLLCCLSAQISNGIIIDIGTHHGNSAVAMGYSKYVGNDVEIYSFDIKNMLNENCAKYFIKSGIKYCVDNVFDVSVREHYKNIILSSKLLMIDIDPHNGILEYQMYEWLRDNNYIILRKDILRMIMRQQ
jgi:hypothetical protein